MKKSSHHFVVQLGIFFLLLISQQSICQNATSDGIKLQMDSLERMISKNNNEIENIKNKNSILDKELSRLKESYNAAIIESQKGTTYICIASTLLYKDTKELESLTPIKKGSKVKVIEVLESHYKVYFNDLTGFVNKYGFTSEVELNNQLEIQTKQKVAEEETEKKFQEEISKEKEERKLALIKKYGKINGVKVYDGEIWIGMTADMVYDSQGKPKDINKTVGSWGVNEQWVYKNNTYLYIENGKLVSWQY